MPTVQINARVDAAVKRAVEEYCRTRGIVMNRFVQEALLDRLEELEDAAEVAKLKREPTRPLAEVLAELKRDGPRGSDCQTVKRRWRQRPEHAGGPRLGVSIG